MQVFAYLSVLVSIIIGLGMAHLLAAAVRLIHNRREARLYWPALAWAVSLFGLLLLVWWADFNLNQHNRWTFAQFVCTVAIPAVLYVAASLILPSADVRAADDVRTAYEYNRVWFLGAVAAGIVLSYVQTFLFDGKVDVNLDNGLKLIALGLTLLAIAVRSDAVQKLVAAVNLGWLLLYVSLLFFNLRET